MNISRAIVLIIIQILLFIIVHDGAVKLYEQLFVGQKMDIGWGITVTVAVWLFSLISVAVGVLCQFVARNHRVTVLLAGYSIFGAFHVQQITIRPYRTLLLLVSAFVALTIPFLVMGKYLKTNE